MQPLKKNRSHLRDTVAVGVAQQGDTVGALNAGTCPVLLYSRNPTLDTAFVLRPRRSIGFGDENVTVWKNVKPTRMVEADREGLDRKAGRGRGARALRPTLRWGDIDGGDDCFSRLGQRGIWAKRCLLRKLALSPQAARNNAIDTPTTAFTFTGVLPIVIRWVRQPDRGRSRACRDLPDRQ